MAGINISDLSTGISKTLNEYTSDVEKALEKSKRKRAKEGAEKLQRNSPRKTGAYAKGWKVKKVGNAQVIHNLTRYQLAHLLEYGHVKKGGGRVPAKVHIRPVEEEVIKNFTDDVEKAIKG